MWEFLIDLHSQNSSGKVDSRARVVSTHKSAYQHAVILDNQNKRKRENRAQENSKGNSSKKRKLLLLTFLKY